MSFAGLLAEVSKIGPWRRPLATNAATNAAVFEAAGSGVVDQSSIGLDERFLPHPSTLQRLRQPVLELWPSIHFLVGTSPLVLTGQVAG